MIEQNNQLPNTEFAEQVVLGSILLDPTLYISTAERLTPEDFIFKSHEEIFRAMGLLSENESSINVNNIAMQLKKDNVSESLVSLDLLRELIEVVPRVRDIDSTIETVSEFALRRRLIETLEDITKDGYSYDVDTDTLLSEAVTKVMQVTEAQRNEGFKEMKNVVLDVYEQTENRAKLKGQPGGIPSGYRDLDGMLNGLNKNDLIILAARPSMGKTAFALNIATHVGTAPEINTVAIFSLEMGADQLVSRMVSSHGMIDSNKMRQGTLDDNDWDKFVTTIGKLSETQMFIDDSPGVRVTDIRSKCLRLSQEYDGVDLVVIDYLQLIQGSSNRRSENRQQEVSEISRMLKSLARELECPVIALSQLSRSVEARQDKRPMMSDLRESGSIEQDADIVAFLYREDYYNRGDGENEAEGAQSEQDEIEVIIAKHRNGPTGTVKLIFNKNYSKFLDQDYTNYEDGYIPMGNTNN